MELLQHPLQILCCDSQILGVFDSLDRKLPRHGETLLVNLFKELVNWDVCFLGCDQIVDFTKQWPVLDFNVDDVWLERKYECTEALVLEEYLVYLISLVEDVLIHRNEHLWQ